MDLEQSIQQRINEAGNRRERRAKDRAAFKTRRDAGLVQRHATKLMRNGDLLAARLVLAALDGDKDAVPQMLGDPAVPHLVTNYAASVAIGTLAEIARHAADGATLDEARQMMTDRANGTTWPPTPAA